MLLNQPSSVNLHARQTCVSWPPDGAD